MQTFCTKALGATHDFADAGLVFGVCALHASQHWVGHKVMAIWKYGKESFPFLDEQLRQLFVSGSSAEDLTMLETACTVAVVSPGDVFMFRCGRLARRQNPPRGCMASADPHVDNYAGTNPKGLDPHFIV